MQYPSLDALKVDKRRISTNGLENLKTQDDALGFISQTRHREYESRNEGGSGLTSIQENVDVSIEQWKYYINKREEDSLQI